MNTIVNTAALQSAVASSVIDSAQNEPDSLRSPFDALHWNAQDLADAVPLRLHALFADGLPPPANDARVAAARRWHQGYLRRRDLPALVRIHN